MHTNVQIIIQIITLKANQLFTEIKLYKIIFIILYNLKNSKFRN